MNYGATPLPSRTKDRTHFVYLKKGTNIFPQAWSTLDSHSRPPVIPPTPCLNTYCHVCLQLQPGSLAESMAVAVSENCLSSLHFFTWSQCWLYKSSPLWFLIRRIIPRDLQTIPSRRNHTWISGSREASETEATKRRVVLHVDGSRRQESCVTIHMNQETLSLQC